MRLLVSGDRICGTATNEYTGPMEYCDCPAWVDVEHLDAYRVEGGQVVEPTLADAKAAKSTEILTGSDAAMNLITASYSENEKLSWPKQEAEAKALLADPDAPAPLLRGIADTRGIALTVLRDKVLANVEASEALTALILGTQQKYEDAVKAATTVEEVQAIEVKYGGI